MSQTALRPSLQAQILAAVGGDQIALHHAGRGLAHFLRIDYLPFGVSATAFHFFRITGRFANFAGIFPSFVGGVLRFCQALGVGLVAL